MKTKLYIDVLFAVNVWMNAGLLYVAGIWSGYRKKALRLLAGASAGGLWTCILAVFPVLPRWAELLLTYGLVGPVMGRLAFPIKGTGNLFRFTAVLSVISIFTGGLISQLYLHTGMGYAVSELLSGGTLYGGSLSVLLLLAVSAFLAGKELFHLFGSICRRNAGLCRVILIRGNRKAETAALVDTGNRLCEPSTGRPVSVAEKCLLETLFPEPEEETGFLLIPYRSIGGSGFLKGRKVDRMIILEQGKHTPAAVLEGAVVAETESRLSPDGSYQLILHGDYAGLTACKGKRRRSNGHQGISSEQVSAENHFQHEKSDLLEKK